MLFLGGIFFFRPPGLARAVSFLYNNKMRWAAKGPSMKKMV